MITNDLWLGIVLGAVLILAGCAVLMKLRDRLLRVRIVKELPEIDQSRFPPPPPLPPGYHLHWRVGSEFYGVEATILSVLLTHYSEQGCWVPIQLLELTKSSLVMWVVPDTHGRVDTTLLHHVLNWLEKKRLIAVVAKRNEDRQWIIPRPELGDLLKRTAVQFVPDPCSGNDWELEVDNRPGWPPTTASDN